MQTYHTNKSEQCYAIFLSPELTEPTFDIIDTVCDIDSTEVEDEHMLDLLIKKIEDNPNITKDIKDELTLLIHQKKEDFGTHYRHLSQTNLLELHVNTGDAKPVMRRPYQGMSLSEQALLKMELQDMVDNGILVPSMHDASKKGD